MKDREQAFEAAFVAHADELFRHAYFRLSDREKARDLVQETYLRAFAYAKQGTIGEMRAFLYRTLRHLIIDEYRRKKTYSLDAIIEEEGETGANLPTDETNTLEAAMARLDGRAALEKLSVLPASYAEALVLRYIDGLSVREIAERIEVSENLVSVRIHRALRALKNLLEKREKRKS